MLDEKEKEAGRRKKGKERKHRRGQLPFHSYTAIGAAVGEG